jgi:outer membrane protein assembly factor BamB
MTMLIRNSVLAGGCGLMLTLVAPAADWPQFLGPHRNGVTVETGISFRWPPGGPPKVWSYSVGVGWSGPIVTGDRVLIHHRVEDAACLDCLQASDGKRLWRYEESTSYQDQFQFDEGPRATPAVADGRVFTFGADGLLRAISLETGRRLWGRDLHTEYRVPQGYFGAACSPLVEGGRVILNVGGRGAGVVAFDAATGKEVWKATDDGASYSSPVAATVSGVRSVFVFTREGLVALDPTKGTVRFKERWRSRNQASVNAATPLVVNDQVFVSSSYQTGAVVWKIRPDGATPLWKGDDVLSNHYNTSVYRDGFLYGIEGRQEYGAHLRCVEWATGKVRWTKERFGCATLALVEGTLLGLTENGDLVAFAASPESYRELARAKVLNGPIRAAFAISGGRLYARDGKELVALNLKK